MSPPREPLELSLPPNLLAKLRAATRPLLFDTGNLDFPVASHGGTVFLVEFSQRVYALALQHCFGDFSWKQMLLAKGIVSGPTAELRSLFKLTKAVDHAVDSDLLDLVAIEFADTFNTNWFDDEPFVLAPEEVEDCSTGTYVYVRGFPAQLSAFAATKADVAAASFVLRVVRDRSSDIALRTATANLPSKLFSNLSGLSGSPVVSERGKLCGIVVRGGIDAEGDIRIHFVEFSDVLQFLVSASRPGEWHCYDKHTLVAKSE